MRPTVLAFLVALVAAAPAAATPRGHAHGDCIERFHPIAASHWGPLTFNGSLDGYKDWDGASRVDDDGTFYAKWPMYMAADKVVSLSIDRPARAVGDWIYGGSRVAKAIRLTGCRGKPSFFAGGLVVKGPQCVPVTLRVRGSKRVYRRVVSVGMGDSCTAPATTAAAVGTRSCRERAESGNGPVGWYHRGDVTLGPLSFAGLTQWADPDTFATARRSDGTYLVKAGVLIKASRVVTLSVRGTNAKLDYAMPSKPGRAVRISSCDRDEPAFSYDGVVGAATGFPGGFVLKEPGCVDLVARVRGSKRVYRKTVSFGAGRCAVRSGREGAP